jgi:hypothetical protein
MDLVTPRVEDDILSFRPFSLYQDWRAINCSLFLTVATYAARINDAILEERLIDADFLPSLYAFDEPPVEDLNLSHYQYIWSHGMTTNHTIRNGKRESYEGSDSPGPGLLKFPRHSDEPTYVNGTGHVNPSAGWRWWYFPMDCVWLLNRLSYLAMSQTLTTLFDQQDLQMGVRNGVEGPIQLRVLFEGANTTLDSINKRMNSLATSMTSVIRTNGDSWSTIEDAKSIPYLANGEMWVTTTCVYIRWPWIAFPAVMVGLSGISLLLVAIESRHIETDRLWKSSFLAALLCEVEVHQQPVGKDEMKTMARSTSVSVGGNSGRLRLVTG